MTQIQAQVTMRWWIGTLLTMSVVMLAGVVWGVRQEGRINSCILQHETDIAYIKEDISEIKLTQAKIYEKVK